MDALGDANTGSMRFSTIYPTSLVGSMTCAMMLSGPCILITTPVFDYPSQLQAVTGTVAHWQGCRPLGVIRTTFLLMPVSSTSQRSVWVLGFGDLRRLTPLCRLNRFLFVRPTFCIRLPSDFVSRCPPCLPLTLPLTGCVKDFHLLVVLQPPQLKNIASHGATHHARRT